MTLSRPCHIGVLDRGPSSAHAVALVGERQVSPTSRNEFRGDNRCSQ